MKKHFLLIIAFVTFSFLCNANTLTVSNNLAHPTTYTDLTTAVGAAAAGDTIYVLGSLTHYAGVTLTKAVNIFGPGFYPQKNNTLTAIVDGINFQANIDGVVVGGMVVNYGFYFYNGYTLNNITLTRNSMLGGGLNFGGSGTITNLKLINSIEVHAGTLLGPGSWTFNNFLVENNVIANLNGPLVNGSFISNTAIFKNNIFSCVINGGNGSYAAFGGSCQQLTLTNNIFIGYQLNSGAGGIDYSTFDHNLGLLATGTYGSDPFAFLHNTSTGNIWDEDPKFVNADNLYPTEGSDFHLKAGSPSLTAASDGGQQGVYGGDPNASWALALMPALPYIYAFNLVTTTVNAGGTINATVISKAHN